MHKTESRALNYMEHRLANLNYTNLKKHKNILTKNLFNQI